MSRGSARYSPRVIELFDALPGAGALTAGPGAVVSGESVALERGAWVRFEGLVVGSRIEDCVFRAWGCPHTLAAAASVALALRGVNLDDAARVDAARLMRELGAPAEKMGRMLVVEEALRSLLEGARAVQ